MQHRAFRGVAVVDLVEVREAVDVAGFGALYLVVKPAAAQTAAVETAAGSAAAGSVAVAEIAVAGIESAAAAACVVVGCVESVAMVIVATEQLAVPASAVVDIGLPSAVPAVPDAAVSPGTGERQNTA